MTKHVAHRSEDTVLSREAASAPSARATNIGYRDCNTTGTRPCHSKKLPRKPAYRLSTTPSFPRGAHLCLGLCELRVMQLLAESRNLRTSRIRKISPCLRAAAATSAARLVISGSSSMVPRRPRAGAGSSLGGWPCWRAVRTASGQSATISGVVAIFIVSPQGG